MHFSYVIYHVKSEGLASSSASVSVVSTSPVSLRILNAFTDIDKGKYAFPGYDFDASCFATCLLRSPAQALSPLEFIFSHLSVAPMRKQMAAMQATVPLDIPLKDGEMHEDDTLVLILGKAGAGKSSLGMA